jgi:putative endonuclease
MHYVYFLKSNRNQKIYTGVTSKEPQIRLIEHNYGSNKFTRENGPFALVYYEKYHCLDDARAREKYYKTGFGRQIRNLIIKYMQSIKDS